MADVEAELRALNDEPIGTVRLAVFQSAIYSLAVPAANRLATTHPHLRLELVEMEPHEAAPPCAPARPTSSSPPPTTRA